MIVQIQSCCIMQNKSDQSAMPLSDLKLPRDLYHTKIVQEKGRSEGIRPLAVYIG